MCVCSYIVVHITQYVQATSQVSQSMSGSMESGSRVKVEKQVRYQTTYDTVVIRSGTSYYGWSRVKLASIRTNIVLYLQQWHGLVGSSCDVCVLYCNRELSIFSLVVWG